MYKYVLLLSSFFLIGVYAQCQEDMEGQRRSDSIQSRLMKDSLNMDSIQIQKVFKARDKYFQKSNQVFQSKNLSIGQKREKEQALREELKSYLKDVLGQAKYQAYKNFISRRIRDRNLKGGSKPLGEDG